MLTHFIYLDEAALDQYVSALEGGLVTGTTKRVAVVGAVEGGADVKILSGKGSRSTENEDSRTIEDTRASRFARLLKAAEEQSDALGWVEVLQPDADLDQIGIGAMVSWECDIYVPDMIRMLSQAGGAIGALRSFEALLPSASALGLDTSGVPEAPQLRAMAGFLEGMQVKTLIVGEDDGTEWRIAGNLHGAVAHDQIDGRAWVVGKVTRVLGEGQWKPYATFPGMDLIPRAQRRAMERQAPAPGKEEEYLRGPALMLDILAIYR